MLQSKFYEILKLEGINENQFDADIQFNNAHTIFEVHFPDQPIVPGACLVQISKEVLQIILKTKISISNFKNLKFVQVINPNEHPIVQMSIKISGNEREQNLKAVYQYDHHTFCKLDYTFTTSDGL